MKSRLVLVVFLGVALPAATSRADLEGWLHEAICTSLEATPAYWGLKEAVEGLKASGALTSEMECLDLGDTINDFSVPDGSYKDCVCEAVGWPKASPSYCSDPHDACTASTPGTNVPLGASSAMLGCTPTATEDVAGKVCASDSFCCQSTWDDICVSEASGAFWSALDAQVEIIANRMDLSCDQKDVLIGNLQAEANADSAQLSCLGAKTYPSNCGDRQYFEFNFGGKCMGVQAGDMTNGTNVIPWSCNATAANGYTQATDQAWVVDLNDCYTRGTTDESPWPQYCSVHDGKNYSKCLGVKAGSTSNGANLVIWDCLGIGHPDQYWTLTQKADGNYYLQNAASAVAKNSDFFALGVHENSSTFNLGDISPSGEFPVTP